MCPTLRSIVKNSPHPAIIPKNAADSGRNRPSSSQIPSVTVVATTSAMKTVRTGGTRRMCETRHSS